MENPNLSQQISAQAQASLLSRAEVARRLGVCVATVVRNKQLPPIKFNARLVRYRAEDVERLIQSAVTGEKRGEMAPINTVIGTAELSA